MHTIKAVRLGFADEPVVMGIEGYEPTSKEIDPPGSANYFVQAIGFVHDWDNAVEPILWTDYDCEGNRFYILTLQRHIDDIKTFCKSSSYKVISEYNPESPAIFGDGNGCVDVVETLNGWTLIRY